MKLKPLFDRVLVREIDNEKSTTNGIILPTSSQERPKIGEVVATGDGTTIDGKEGKMKVTVGQKIVFNRFTGSEIKLDSKEFILLKQTDIMAVLED